MRTNKNKKILVNPSIANGNPYLVGTRLTVFDIVYSIENDSLNEFLVLHPHISQTAILEVLRYCSNLQCKGDKSYCGGCSLRQSQDGISSMEDFINRFSEIHFERSKEIIRGAGTEGIMLMPGTPEELPANWRSDDGWLMAKKILSDYEWS